MNMEVYYTISESESKRLNIMKFLLALFVVYIHLKQSTVNFSDEAITLNLPNWFSYYTYTFSEVIPRCAVSGFFLMSSLLLYRKEFSWSENIKKRIKTLLIPYLIMNTLWIFIFALFQRIPQTQVFFHNENKIVANFSWFQWLQAYGIGARYPFLYPLWFIRNLLIFNVLAVIIKKIIDFAPKISLIIVCTAFLFLQSFPLNNFGYTLFVSDLCMWCFGYFIVKYKWDINKYDGSKFILISFVILLIARVAMKDISIPILNTLIPRISFVVSLIFWYSWFSKFETGRIQKIFLKFAHFNFGIYIFHEMSLSFSKKLIARIFGTSFIVQILQYMILPGIIVMGVILFCIILKRFFPRVFSVLTGSRV